MENSNLPFSFLFSDCLRLEIVFSHKVMYRVNTLIKTLPTTVFLLGNLMPLLSVYSFMKYCPHWPPIFTFLNDFLFGIHLLISKITCTGASYFSNSGIIYGLPFIEDEDLTLFLN